MLKVGDKVKFHEDYDGYFKDLKGVALTITFIERDEYSKGYYLVKVKEIDEIHLINTLWLESVAAN